LNDTSIPTSIEMRDHIAHRACNIRGLHLQETVNFIVLDKHK